MQAEDFMYFLRERGKPHELATEAILENRRVPSPSL